MINIIGIKISMDELNSVLHTVEEMSVLEGTGIMSRIKEEQM